MNPEQPYNKNWTKLWWSAGYQSKKQAGFDALDAYLATPPKTILDIGCGMAWESRKFAGKYGTELWLIDGDVESNKNKTSKHANYGKWHNTTDTMLFYHSLDFIKEKLDEDNIKNYHLIDTNNIQIPSDMKFDLITSWLSCGFHYPVSIYRDLILKHSHENTIVSMDLRLTKQSVDRMPALESGVELVKVVHTGKKHVHGHIKFV
jgi:SAM-dependent methyltransferase